MAPLPRNEVTETSHLLEDPYALRGAGNDEGGDIEEEIRRPHSESHDHVVKANSMLPNFSFYCYQGNDDEYVDLQHQLQQQSFWKKYNNILERRPLLVKSLTAFVLLGLADVCAQTCQHFLVLDDSDDDSSSSSTTTESAIIMTDDVVSAKSNDNNQHHIHDSWDFLRSLRFGIFGLVGAPWSHYYFDWLDSVLPPTPNRPCSWVTFAKLFIDQFLQAPLLLGVIMVAIGAMEAQGFSSIIRDLQHRYWGTLVANCTYDTDCTGFNL